MQGDLRVGNAVKSKAASQHAEVLTRLNLMVF
jgi:hypothetical protein